MPLVQIDYNDPTVDWNAPLICYNGGCPDEVDLRVKGGGSGAAAKRAQKPKQPAEECEIFLRVHIHKVNGHILPPEHKNPICYKGIPAPAKFTVQAVKLTNSENQNIIITSNFIPKSAPKIVVSSSLNKTRKDP
jgi:hypothetical protein